MALQDTTSIIKNIIEHLMGAYIQNQRKYINVSLYILLNTLTNMFMYKCSNHLKNMLKVFILITVFFLKITFPFLPYSNIAWFPVKRKIQNKVKLTVHR